MTGTVPTAGEVIVFVSVIALLTTGVFAAGVVLSEDVNIVHNADSGEYVVEWCGDEPGTTTNDNPRLNVMPVPLDPFIDLPDTEAGECTPIVTIHTY